MAQQESTSQNERKGESRLHETMLSAREKVASMKTRRGTISQRVTRSKTSNDGGETSLPIPIDLIFDIFSRLPTKSIARCRCVSKPWASILGRPEFTEVFLTKSSAKPQILISLVKVDELLLFSAPQVQNPNESSSVVAADYLTKFPVDYPAEMYGPVHGLVFLNNFQYLNGKKENVQVAYNPSTGQSLHLPTLKTVRTSVNSFFGYDPIDKQYKVLSLSWLTAKRIRRKSTPEKHKVLTLGTKKRMSWRVVERLPINFAHRGICIDGVLYYLALVDGPPRCSIVCFDVRSEKYTSVNRNEEMALFSSSTLVNYKGKLGVLLTDGFDELTEKSTYFELWVLVDAEKHEWSKHVYPLPDSWKDVIGDAESYLFNEAKLHFAGLTCTNEVVLSQRHLPVPFHVFYYSLERKTIKRVEVQGMDAFKDSEVHILLNHVEDVKLLQTF